MNAHRENAPQSDSHNESEEVSSEARWWLAKDDKAQGPHTDAYVTLLLEEGRIDLSTLVCPLDGDRWEPLGERSEFAAQPADNARDGSPPPIPPAENRSQKSKKGFFARFTSPKLPRIANCICFYCIVIVPTLTAVDFLFMVGGSNSAVDLKYDSPLVFHAVAYDVIVFLADVALAVVLVIGGLSLRSLQKKGSMLIKVGLTLRLCWLVIGLLTWVFWSAIVTAGDASQPVSEEFTTGDIVMLLLLVPFIVLALACTVFEVVALVWLIENDHRLPLKALANEEVKP